MIAGWRPWERWTVASRLARHARREGGEPPPDLLRRLREDIPARPELLRQLERPPVAAGERRIASRRWLAAASLAAALTATAVGLRVWQEHSRDAGRRLAAVSPGIAPGSVSEQANPTSPSPAFVVAPPAVARPVPLSPPALPSAASPAGPPGAAGGFSARGPARPGARVAAGGPAAAPETAAGRGETAGGFAGGVASPHAGTDDDGSARGTAEELESRPEAAAGERTAQVPADPPPARLAQAPGAAAPLRSSFGADTGLDSYRRVRRGLLAEGRLPRAASVRADELANAFVLPGDVPAVGRPELSVEGAPLPAAGAAYLLRFEVRGLMGRSSPDAVEVDFDPTVVARFRRVGATAHRGGAAALYEIELRPVTATVAGAAPAAPAVPEVTAASRPGGAAAATRTAATPGRKASPQRQPGEPQAAPASWPGGDGARERVIATLRVVPRDERSLQGGAVLAQRVVRLSELHPSWKAASPALRVQGLAVELAQALAASDPAPSLQALRARAQALADELPDDPKAAELLQLVDRAADLAGDSGGTAPRPP